MAAEAALSYVVQTLGNLLVEKVKFLRGVEGEVLWLKDELKRMQSFLKDAAEKQVNDERVRNWISEIRELALDSQDAIEMFVLKAQKGRRSKLGLPGKCVGFPCHMYINKIGEEIESIRKRLRDIESSRQTFGILQDPLAEGGADSSSRRRLENVERRRRLTHWEDDKDVVGLDEDKKLMVEKLAISEEKGGLAVATIVGMGGIGKSTLAQKVYNDKALSGRFECRAWVVVSSQFTPEETMKQLIVKLQKSKDEVDKVRKDIKELEESTTNQLFLQEELQRMLRQHLEGKSYFIVLDDVWEQTHWESLRNAFPDQPDKTSVLLVTSRNKLIVRHAQYVHEMKCLGPEDSWDLFLKKVFIDNGNHKCPEGLESTGTKILEKCHGLPLAICVVGGLLVEQKESISGWEKVLRGIQSHLGRSQSSVSAILELSYGNLDPQLKSCFLFLSLFKEDASISAKKLIYVWIALDMVLQEAVGSGETMEDIARGYLDELINRNMLQIEKRTKDGRVKTCRIHDLLRDLSIEKAKEEINFGMLKEEGNSHSSRHLRHLSTYCSEERLVNSIANINKHLRSLFIHSNETSNAQRFSSNLKRCELLRVLDVGDFLGFGNWPNAIGSFIGLRYLAIDNLAIDTVQSSRWLLRFFNKLENLQVLDFPSVIVDVPDSMWKKESLCHLKLRLGYLRNPHMKIQILKNLHTLGYLQLEDPFVEQLTRMPALRKLGLHIRKISDGHKLFTILGKLENLIRLHLWHCHSLNMDGLATLHLITQLKLVGRISRLPTKFPPNLSYLTMAVTGIFEDPMPVLEKLPNLLYIKLDYRAYVGEKMEISHVGFQSLKQFYLSDLHDLRNIIVGEGAMPQLQRGEIIDCSNLKTENINLPQHLREIIDCSNETPCFYDSISY